MCVFLFFSFSPDTENLYTEIMQKMCDPYGKKFTWEVKMMMMGKKQEEAANVFIENMKIPISVTEYKDLVDGYIREIFPHAAFLPGAERLVKHLHSHGIPLALATGSHGEEFELKTSKHQDIFSLFSHCVLSSEDPDVSKGKPAPDCFLVAAQRFQGNVQSNKVLVFEDAPNGVRGALAAGMQVVWVPDSDCVLGDLGDSVTSVLKSLEEFAPEDFGLPAYD
ncbi:hypothetical protein CAPTEDRAFT_128552 [Capitella teleta]|uniref:pseudouridine 5'-phosphatase n=1 Tax=Capitella teleta TaxID=283909 RepID=R7U4M5_CAPTE|nr:hypothetical protein CAPTEDRAFT_128552 [Capitella teleta]|eukprot:ELT98115.1 hypothetical protein CAPTEDRAFT_128552 [Capitella teleta]